MSKARKPILGAAFNPETMNELGRVDSYISELEHYRPRGFYKLAREGTALRNAVDHDKPEHRGCDIGQYAHEWSDDCDQMLTAHAERCGMDFVSFGPFEHGGAIGYSVNIDSAKEDSLVVADTSEVPRGYRGYVLHVNDHGNASLYRSNRRGLTEIWAVV